MNYLDRTHRNSKKSTKLTDDKLSLICTVLSALCGYLTGGFTILISKDGTSALICAITFTALTVLFVVLSYSFHLSCIKKARTDGNRNYLRFRN